MRALKRLAAVTATAGLLLVPAAAASASAARTAAPSWVTLRGGVTRVTTAPGIAPALIKNGIIPIATWPGRERLRYRGGVAAQFSFPVTGGRVSLSPLAGSVRHAGGILFIDAATGKSIKVSRFTINLHEGDLTGIVNGNPKARVAIFRLGLKHAKLAAAAHSVRATGIVLRLTKTAAGALNASLGTSLFSGGLKFGTAATTLRF